MKTKKKRAITKFIILSLLAVVLLVLSVLQFNIPYSENRFNGFIKSLNTSMSFNGGTTLTYKVKNTGLKDNNTHKGVEAYSLYLTNALYSKYYYNAEANGYHAGSDAYYITLSLYDVYCSESSEIDDLGAIEAVLNANTTLEFKGTNSETEEAALTESDIKNVTGLYSTQQGQYGVNIEFTKEGQEKFKNLTKSVSDTSNGGSGAVYIFVAGTLFNQISVSETIDLDSVFISGSVQNLAQAKAYAAQFNAAKYDLEFTRENIEVVTPAQATANKVLTAVVMSLIVVLGCVLLITMFKHLGLAISLSMILASLTYLILLQAIPGIFVADVAFVAMAIAFSVGIFMSAYMLNNMKKEYALGKKLPLSIKFGFNKSYAFMLDIFALLVVPSIIMFLFGNVILKSFGTVLLIGLIIYTFFAILINKVFANWYTKINSKDAKKYGFKREANINELS